MKTKQPLVSIIMPCYNGEKFIGEAIESVLKQTYQNWELIIVDDGSIDNSKRIIKQYYSDERIQYIQHKKNRGIPATRNTGIKTSKSEFIAFLDQDDLWLKEKLKQQVQILNKDQYREVGLVFSDAMYLIGGKIIKREWPSKCVPKNLIYKPKEKILRSLFLQNFVPIENMKREEVIQLLQRAKIYIDFGSHPGKDRIPREAAVLECCVITGKRGSAKYRRDINIPEKYKFEEKDENIPYIISLIKECFANYEEKLEDFCEYRAQIYKEKEKFKEDLKGIFVKVKEKRSQAYKIHFS